MEAIPFCLSQNKLRLFSRTPHRFILIQILPSYMCFLIRANLGACPLLTDR
jgi:hypothetical protein